MRIRPLFFPVLGFLLQLSARAYAQAPPEAPPAENAPPQAPAEAPPAESAPPAATEPAAEAVGEGEDPSRPPPKGKGVIWGVVTDTKLHEPLIEVQVSAIGTKFKAVTDIDGRYRLELPPGAYNLRFFYEQHDPVRIDKVRVAAGQVTKVDAELNPSAEEAEVTEVETEADKAAVEGQILKRQRSAAVGDSVGRAEIAKTPDRNAAQAAQRVVGATIVGGRFVYVRGLGERYTNSMLNGAPLPSPEPDINAVPLDLFPTLVLDSLTIAKTFTPDTPGDFAGGSVRIETREIPSKFVFSASASAAYNTKATFRDRLSYRGGSLDWLGFDNGTRSIPDEIPTEHAASVGATKPGGGTVTEAEVARYGEAINAFMSTERSFTPPNFGANVVVGDGTDVGKEQKIGYLAAVTYGRSYINRGEILREFRADSADPRGYSVWNDFKVETGIDAVRWGAFGSVSYQLAKGHRLHLIGMRSQLSDDTGRIFDGFRRETAARVHITRLQFVSRALSFGQLRGEHDFSELGKANLGWNMSLAHAERDEPDTRDTVYQFDDRIGSFRYLNNSDSGRHFWADQGETSLGGGLDWTQPISDDPEPSKLKLGGLVNLRSRGFLARRFHYGTLQVPRQPPSPVLTCPGSTMQQTCIDDLFTEANIGARGSVPPDVLELEEGTRASDAYDATLNVFAGYVMADVNLTSDLRLIAGERLEATHQTIDPVDQFDTGAVIEGAQLDSVDALPALSVVYSATKKAKLRASATRTLARPQLRELAPFEYTDYFGGYSITGNPELRLTRITNLDLRFEFFPTVREVLAFSVFQKHFKDPIEPLLIPSASANVLTYRNSAGANLIGVELEARKNLGFLHDALDVFSVIGNLLFARSRIQVEQTGQDFITNTSRPLVNQSPYVINVALDYENTHGTSARLLYNVVGPQIVGVGTRGVDDQYLQDRHRIDFSIAQKLGKHFEVKGTAENIFNSRYVVTIGPDEREDNIVRRYSDGSVYGVSATYSY